MQIKNFFNLKVFVLAFLVSFIFCFFIGIFWNHNIKNKNGEYYINRGYPVAWAGVTTNKIKVNFPIVKAPFILKSNEPNAYVKIIDLGVFVPLFMGMFIINYPVQFVIYKAVKENNKLIGILRLYFGLLLIGCGYFYFFWFPRI